MPYPVQLRVWGDWACFTRPEMKVERVSYDVLTPSAARNILQAIYWKPEFDWLITRIHVLKPIQFMNLRRNEIGSKIPAGSVKSAMNKGKGELRIFVDDDRQQRATMLLRDVDYLVEADIHLRNYNPNDNPKKHQEMFKRRAIKGQCFTRPYLGCREFDAHFAWHVGPPPSSCHTGTRPLGYMLYDIDYKNDMTPSFFNATMVDGVIEIPDLCSEEVKS